MSDMMMLYGYYEDSAKEAEKPEQKKQFEWLARLVANEIKKGAE